MKDQACAWVPSAWVNQLRCAYAKTPEGGLDARVLWLSSGGACSQFNLPRGSPSAWAERGLWGSGQQHLPSFLFVPATLARASISSLTPMALK